MTTQTFKVVGITKHNGNTVDVLTELWNIEETRTNVAYDEMTSKWKQVREICQSYEDEMEAYMNNLRQQHANNQCNK